MMQKWFAVLSLTALTLVPLAGCAGGSSPEDTSDSGVKIEFDESASSNTTN
jgi:hypothetical protein